MRTRFCLAATAILSRRKFILLLLGTAFVLYFLIFGRVLDNYFVGDDWAFLDEVSRVHSPGDIAAFFSFGTVFLVRPLEKMITWLMYSGFGLNYVVFHSISLLLDLANTVLLGILAFLLFKGEKQSDSTSLLGASAVSVLFAFNSTHHEAIFWYSALNEPLTAFLRLAGLVLFVAVLSRHDVSAWAIRGVLVALALLALLAKESAIVFPIELFLFFVYFRAVGSAGRVRWANGAALLLVFLVVLGWLVLYVTLAPAGIIENGRGGVKLTLGSLPDWLVRIPFVFNSTTLGLDAFSTIPRTGWELVLMFVFVGLALLRRRFVWILALLWTIIVMLPYAALFPATEMMGYLQFTLLSIPVRYFYFITAGSGLLLVATLMWLVQELDTLVASRVIRLGVRALVVLLFVGLLALNIQKLVEAENDWDISGQTVLRLSRQLEPVVSSLKRGDTLCLTNLPDHFKFKWTFRNAAWGVLYLTYHRSDYTIVPMTNASPPLAMNHCTVQRNYNPESENFE